MLRNAWKAAHRAHRRGLRNADLFAAILDATGETWRGVCSTPNAARMLSQLQRNDHAPTPLAVTVLNCWGNRGAFRSPDPGPGSYYQPNAAYRAWHRHTHTAERLRESFIARGLATLDSGNWVREVLR